MLLATPAAKEQAYAGPTFQTSPAPSSLPVPKFFSRSVPNVAAPSLSARMEGEKTPEKDDSSPESDIVSPQPSARSGQRSPLDLFFNADREEKERSRSSSSLSPEMAVRKQPPATEPRRVQQLNNNASLQDSDGDSSDMISPKSAPPNKRHVPTQRPPSSTDRTDIGSGGESEHVIQTKALKELLFSNVNASTQQSTTPPGQPYAHSNSRAPAQAFETPSPFQRSTSGPSTPTPSAEQQNHYSIHYGNRNLSPLFKAARNESSSRPSGLRQLELASDMSPNPAIPLHPHLIDPNSFSRNYINQHIHSTVPASPPQLPLGDSSNPNLLSDPSFPSTQHGAFQNDTMGSTSNSGATPRSTSTGANANTGGGARDVKGMEDNLRKMLNLNILSN